MYPNFNHAATEAAITGHGVLFQYKDIVGVVWWEGNTYSYRGLKW